MSTAESKPEGTPDWKSLTSQSAVPFRYTKNHIHHTWAKTHYTRPELYLQPESVKEIQHIVNTARECRKKIITVGSGHCPSDITIPKVPKDTWIVNLDKFSRVIGYSDDTTDAYGEKELLITVQAGIRLHQLAAALAKKGWNMPNLGSIWEQSIAGAIATSTHGSSMLHGLLSENVKKLTIMLSDGKSYDCSKDHNQELFEAALVSLGALGIVTYVTFAAVPQYRVSWQQEIWNLNRVLAAWEGDLWTQSEYARVWWFPYSEKTIVWRADKVQLKEVYDEVTGGVKTEWEKELVEPPHSWYGTWMGYHAYQVMLYVARWFPRLTPYVERFVFKTQYGWEEGVIGKAVEAGEKALLLDCLFSQYVNEWAIPLERGPEAISRLQSWLMGAPHEVHGIPVDNHGMFVHAPIEVRVSNSSYKHVSDTPSGRRALLDTSNPDGPSLYLNATLYRPYLNRGDVAMRRRYYRAFEWLMRQYNGRPHWAKNFLVGNGGEVELGCKDEGEKELLGGGEAWDEMYGSNIRRWRAIRAKADPEGVFRSEWLERTVLSNEGKAFEGAIDGNGEASTVLVEEGEALEFIPYAEVE